MTAPPFSWSIVRGHIKSVGGRYNAAMDMFSRIYASRLHFYSASMHERTADYDPYKDLGLNLDRMRRWQPLNQGLCLTARTLLPGMLLSAKGDLRKAPKGSTDSVISEYQLRFEQIKKEN